MNEGNITYFCLAEHRMQAKVAFGFLEAIQKQFQQTYSLEQQNQSVAFGLQQFQKIIQDKMVALFLTSNSTTRLPTTR
jgi:hypothetical protein